MISDHNTWFAQVYLSNRKQELTKIYRHESLSSTDNDKLDSFSPTFQLGQESISKKGGSQKDIINFLQELDQRKVGSIHISHSQLRNVTKNMFTKFEHCMGFTLIYNEISYVDPLAFNYTGIRHLSLNYNKLNCEPDLRAIKSSLEYLDLNGNQLGQCKHPGPNINTDTRFQEIIHLYLTRNKLLRNPTRHIFHFSLS